MKLERIKYFEHPDSPRFWELRDCSFRNINLIVGKNASGKTRTLNIIRGLSNLLAEEKKLRYISGNYSVEFTTGDKRIYYELKYEKHKVIKEELMINKEKVLEREENGEGSIRFQKEDKMLRFQTPSDEIAALARRDTIQHPFLEDLYKWGSTLYYYPFGSEMGKDRLIIVGNKEKIESVQDGDDVIKDTNRVIEVFIKGRDKFGDSFINSLLSDMEEIGYYLDDIEIGIQETLSFPSGRPIPSGISVKEKNLQRKTDQFSMAQGMFRSLSILIQVNYSIRAESPSCILVDDIGEGLDFERSTALIKLLIDKAKQSTFQLIMTTNDRFVMNNVPLEYWIILQREESTVNNYNYENSKELFDKFELTGLNNFDLFSSRYYMKRGNGG